MVIFQRALTFLFVVLGWAFFRSDNMSMASTLLRKMFIPVTAGISFSSDMSRLILWNAALLLVVNILTNSNSFKIKRSPVAAVVFACLFVLSILVLNSFRIEFLYYQF